MSVETKIRRHVSALLRCDRCPLMHKPVVSGPPIVSRIILVGQAPGDKEPIMGRPFAWTAGKTLFRWFDEGLGWTEAETRARIYFAAVCRCFPGKNPTGGDRVPNPQEIENCSDWMNEEFRILRPSLVIPVGKLAIRQFLEDAPLNDRIGKSFKSERQGIPFDIIPLPHPSGASPWHRMEPGKSLLKTALKKIANHPAVTG
ncbi:MAG: uracil-DNA glycosylase family protein [Chthoniobacterales bacterium]